jgi:nitric oxide reductase large subunit
MTELPPTEDNAPDDEPVGEPRNVFVPTPEVIVIGSDDDELDDPWHDQIVEVSETFGAPDVLAVLAFVMAVGSLLAFGLMNGTTYVYPSLTGIDGRSNTPYVLATMLGAGLALLPVWLGWRASSRSLPTDPRWIVVLARSAVILGLSSGALRLVVAVVQAAHDGPSLFSRL